MVKLNEMLKGSIIKFAGSNWILLDPSTGYVISQSIYSGRPFHTTSANGKFTPDEPNNIGYYLNVTYYNSLSEVDKQIINPRVWKTGFNSMESLTQVTANIGLLSYSEWEKYSSTIGRPTETFWTLTRSEGEFGHASSVWIVNDDNGGYLSAPINFYEYPHGVRPTLTLKPTVNIIDGVAVGNVAPTQPGAFIQPTGTLEIGDSKVFSVGASSDEDGNLSKYIWEVSINGASYSKAGETTTPNFTYTIPTATSLKMRVKAMDTGGLESAYRESSSYTVTKPKYYWSKYTSVSNNLYNDDAPWESIGPSGSQFRYKYKGYTLDRATNTYIMTNPWGDVEPVSIGDIAYSKGNLDTLFKDISIENGYSSDNLNCATHKKVNTKNTFTTTYSRGSLVQSNIQADEGTYPTDGRHTDGFWYVRGSRVSQTISPPSVFTSPSPGKVYKPSENASIVFGASSAPSISLYEADYRYGSTGAWTSLAYNNTLTRSLTITTNSSLKTIEFRVRAKNTSNVYSDYIYSEAFVIEHNVAPTVILTSPPENVTLYENDTLNIVGTAYDADADQSVTVYYQINSEQRKVLATNLSQTQIALSKQLKFKAGKLFDGDTALTGTLSEGVPHKLKVWATDTENAQSEVVERSFYVVPNRAPMLTVNPPTPSGIIDSDSFVINGSFEDLDKNETTVSYRINGANSVQIANGTSGTFEFNVSLGVLKVGENVITVEAIDSYGAKTTQTVKLRKNKIAVPIHKSTARYKITPPTGTASEILVWVQHDAELTLKASASMTLAGEQESFKPMALTVTENLQNGQVEDEFYLTAGEAKDSIVLQLELEKSDVNADSAITLIMGVL